MAKDDEEQLGADVLAWLQSEQMNEVADYVRRGRRFAHLSDDDLKAAWIVAFERSAENLRNRELRDTFQDFGWEFALRGQEVPLHMAKDAWRKMRKGIKKMIFSMGKEAFHYLAEKIEEGLAELKSKSASEQH